MTNSHSMTITCKTERLCELRGARKKYIIHSLIMVINSILQKNQIFNKTTSIKFKEKRLIFWINLQNFSEAISRASKNQSTNLKFQTIKRNINCKTFCSRTLHTSLHLLEISNKINLVYQFKSHQFSKYFIK